MPNIILLCCQIVSNTAIDMQKLLSLPPNLVSAFYELENVDRTEWFCTSDPVGMKLGSGGGTTWLLREWQKERDRKYLAEERIPTEKCIPTEKSLPAEKRSTACRRTKPSFAGICTVGQDIDPDSGVSLGAWTKTGTEFIIPSTPTLRKDNGAGSRKTAYADCQW